MGNDRKRDREHKKKETNKTMEQENLQESLRNKIFSTREGSRDPNTPMCEGDRGSEMTLSEVGTEDIDLRDIIKREWIDLHNILDLWKEKWIYSISSEQLDRIH
jgi:hypothetical protein